MTKADLHVHSKYSNHPSEWFLQRLGASESYTEPEFIYQSAKERGMDFVTVTDHNKIEASLLLKERYPNECFTGVESTAYFPEDGCKVHILIYGFTERRFAEIQHCRKNVYDLRDYLFENHLAHSVAHATYSVNNRLTVSHLERLILLFDVFEGTNGGRNRFHNDTWTAILSSLSPDKLDDLWRRYRIEPLSDAPWVKGFTGGSDDHAGLFIGQTFTCADAASATEFIDRIRNRLTRGEGRYNDYKSLAFMFYKIAYDFYRHKSGRPSSALFGKFTEYVFKKKEPGLKDRLLLRRWKSSLRKDGRRIHQLVSELLNQIENLQTSPLEERLDVIYDNVAEIADEFFKMLLESIEKDLLKGDIISVIRNLSASIPGIFLSVPFFSTIRLMTDNRKLLSDLRVRFEIEPVIKDKTILWFTDTIDDLNGVAMTLRKVGSLALERDLPLFIVSASPINGDGQNRLPMREIILPSIHSFRLPGYDTYLLKIPSILHSLEKIYNANPDEIIISTPGPVGMLGLLAAKLLHVKSVGIYHTDFTLQAQKIIPDESVARLLENLARSFYSAMDEIQVPTQEYIQILESRGFDLSKMRVFRRGIDADLFAPQPGAKERIEKRYGLDAGFNLLYTGRISRDKDLPFLLKVYRHLQDRNEKWNLLLVGDGPYLRELQTETRRHKGVRLVGRVDYEALPEIYSAADLFVFPSTTDTFGMVVLEAQACGLPAVVSDRGGPKEIIEDHRTGLIARAASIDAWVEKIVFLRNVWQTNPRRFARMKEEARQRIVQSYSWERVIKEMFDEKNSGPFRLRPQQRPEPDGRGFPQQAGRAQV
jgi:glycosyltransferase involved in cell wall biosynthesis